MTSIINAIVECLTGIDTTDFSIITSEKTRAQEEDMATSILDIIYSASDRTEITKALQEKVSTTGWTEYVAKCVLVGLENALKKAAPMGDALKDAFNKAKTEALEWLEKPEVYWTIVALGVLIVLTPWVVEILGFALEWLGFAELGPVEGSFAAAWMRTFAGYVPKNSLFSYFQRMGMVWKAKTML